MSFILDIKYHFTCKVRNYYIQDCRCKSRQNSEWGSSNESSVGVGRESVITRSCNSVKMF